MLDNGLGNWHFYHEILLCSDSFICRIVKLQHVCCHLDHFFQNGGDRGALGHGELWDKGHIVLFL